MKQNTTGKTVRTLTMVLLLLLATLSATAQQRATTEDGATVLLYADGTWGLAGEDGAELETSPVTLELISFGFVESGPDNDYANDYRDWFDIVFDVTNNTESPIRAARGVVLFQDLLGDIIWRVNLQISDPMEAGQTIQWIGKVDFQTFNDSHRRMKNLRVRDMAVVFDDVQAIYAEGE